MSKRATLVLAVVVLGLLAYILKFERSSLTSRELDQREGKVLTAFVREKVERLEIQRKGRLVVLARSPNEEGGFGSWRMVEPWQGEADESEVDRVLGELEWLDARRRLRDLSAKDKAQFGLDKPRYRISYTAGGQTQRLSLGQNDVHGEGVYAALEGDPTAYVVPKTLVETLDHEPGHYRGKGFLGDLVTAWGRTLTIVGADGKLVLNKREGRWWLAGEGEKFADTKAVEKVMRGLDSLRAVRFLEGAEAERAQKSLSQPTRTVELRIVPDEVREDKTPQLADLRIGGECEGHAGEHYAASGEKGTPVCVKDEDLTVFAPGPTGLLQAQAIGAEPSEIESFELTSAKEKVALKREGESWKAEGGKPVVDREAVEQWIEDLGTERALSYVKLGPLEERARLTVHLADDKTQTVVVGPVTPDGNVLVRRDQEPTLVLYRSALVDLLTPSPRRFAPLELWSHQPSEVQAFDARSGALQRKLVLADGSWRTDAKSPEVADSTHVRELLRELVRVRALSFVTERARPEHGLDAARAALVLSLKGEGARGSSLKLELGAPTARGAYARVAGGPVYDVPREIVNMIDELAGAVRVAPPVEPDEEATGGPDEEEGLPEHADEEEHDHP